jgi:hypothetical protein
MVRLEYLNRRSDSMLFREKTKDEVIADLKMVLDYLLPTWQKGDIVRYNKKDYIFSCFSYSETGMVYANMTATDADPNDFFSGSVIPLKRVMEYKEDESNGA